MKKALFIFIIILVGAVPFVFYGPVLAINGDIVHRSEFKKGVKASTAAQNAFAKEHPELPTERDEELDIMNMLLEDRLIRAELKKTVDAATLQGLLKNKLQAALENQAFLAASKELYGLNEKDVRKIILVPQAEEDILRSQFVLQNADFGEWLMEAKKTASISIYSRGFRWDGEAVKRK